MKEHPIQIPPWDPTFPPIYDPNKTYAENGAEGPFFTGPIPPRPPGGPLFDFLGFPVRSLIGVPAGPLLNGKWISLASKLGFDILTYKTIRSEAHPSHRLPNICYIDPDGHRMEGPSDLSNLTITNSFGMPSQSPDFILSDIDQAARSLSTGQVMIVSVVGTPHRGGTFGDDFVRTALLARAAGAQIIEANFSCPNVSKGEGILYQNPETVHEYTRLISKAIHPTPLILKVGVFSDPKQMQKTFLAAARGGARGICGINSVSMPIDPPLDRERTSSGVCGAAIRSAALDFCRTGAEIIEKNKLPLILLGCGGIMLPEHFELFFEAKANAALTASGMMWDPYLAMRYHARLFSHS